MYDHHNPIQTFIITLLRNVMLTVPKGAWATCGSITLIPPFVRQITSIECVLSFFDSYQQTFANRSHVKYEFTNTSKLFKKLAGIEASSICRQQFVNEFGDCFCVLSFPYEAKVAYEYDSS